MDAAASFYPPISERKPIPPLYAPACFLLTILPFVFPNKRFGVLVTLPILLLLCIRAPTYTFGSPSADYYNSGPFLAMLLWYLDFVVLTPWEGPEAAVFLGDASHRKHKGRSWISETTVFSKLRWATRLMIAPNRGIGWNWQVKGVPSDPRAHLQKWSYVKAHLWRATWVYLHSVAMLVILGCSSVLEQAWPSHTLISFALNGAIGWSDAAWVWDRLNCFYSLAAALSVAIGLSDTWEWPPLTGRLKDAWSVRQMWSVVYHQVMRRMLQQPAIRLSRFLGLRKGSFSSRYGQLFITFAVSCLYHEFQIFNVTRKDGGEFGFFITQPIAIAAEELVQWLWRKCRRGKQSSGLDCFGTVVGYGWVILWFGYSLPPLSKGLRDAGIIRDALLDTRPFDYGSSLGTAFAVSVL